VVEKFAMFVLKVEVSALVS